MFDAEELNVEEEYKDFEQPDDGLETKYYAVAVRRTTGISDLGPNAMMPRIYIEEHYTRNSRQWMKLEIS